MTIQMPPFLSDDQIEAEAQTILNEIGDVQLPIDPVEIARRLGVEVFAADMDMEVSGALIRSDGDPRIYFNQAESRTRQRFTVAHEIAHFVLHNGTVDIVDSASECSITFRRTVDPWVGDKAQLRREIQANKFAAALLIPSDLLRQVLSDNEDLGDLARIFGVSKSAIGYRINSLCL